jgi:hypothetical protein
VRTFGGEKLRPGSGPGKEASVDGQPKSGNGQLIGGIILIALGVLFLLDRFFLLDFGWIISRFWPAVLIFIGVMQILHGRARSLTGPLVLIAMGAIFQADRLRLFDWRFQQLWPVILIVIGVALLTDRLRRLRPAQHAPSRGTPQQNPPG